MFTKHRIEGQTLRHLFNSEIEKLIKDFAEENNLKLPGAFCRSDYEFFSQIRPEIIGYKYVLLFLASPKTADEILREQIEFQIKQLEK